jgi:hypothetical protein
VLDEHELRKIVLVLRQGQGVRAWRNKILEFKDLGSFAVARLSASSYPATVSLYAGGSLAWSRTFTGDDDVKLPSGLPNARRWGLDVQCAGEVYELHLVGRVAQEVKSGFVKVRQEEDPLSLLCQRIYSPSAFSPSSARVLASAYPVTLSLATLAGTLILSVQAADDRPFRLPPLGRLYEAEVTVVAPAGAQVYSASLATSLGLLGR